MKNFSFSVILLFVLLSSSLAQWRRVETLPTWTFYGGCVDAIEDNFAVFTNASGKILITTDSGTTWTTKNSPQEELVVDISLVSNNIFFIATSGQGNTAGNFYKTTDAGNTWTTLLSGSGLTSCGNYIEMFSETSGIAVGDGPYLSYLNISNQPLILRTTNGTQWQSMCSQNVGFSADTWRRINFVDESNGYFFRAGISPEVLLKTTDGGTTWTTTNFSGKGWLIKFYNKDYGLVYNYDVTTQNNNVKRTTSGGSDWQEFHTEGMGRIEDIEFIVGNPSNVWLGASDGLYFSADSGKIWTKKISSERVDDVVFPTENTGWALTTTGLYYTDNGGLITNVVQEKNLPTSFQLFQNYPNPFNPETVIRYQLSVAGHVTLKIYDLLGKEVATLVNEEQKPGIHNSTFNINNYALPSGIYFYRLTAGDYSSTQKMVLLK